MLDEMLDEKVHVGWNRIFAFAHSSNKLYFKEVISMYICLQNGRYSNSSGRLSELLDSDDEKPVRGKIREWVKRKNEKGYYNNIVKELKN